ncbi:hypothetical protein [Tenacibaculum finnmarkense]|uniref:hypothetical protein n=1 Tax=Tenacibaculum finnmarkense TaxID=2781243 RepID=UPI001EFA9B96|nr:hypothetical protein [Tenacibaculum finnmarkense]MCG8207860.1 hypothetical protein [Tenacibaculum finnmarkense genomovar finnmarkense]MCG8723922.1 hypothetical protein [Tenacibaculum finnmarkense]MCG8765629.1 hypothetical protein [Tenacibaculum finnmarkense]MCG8778555.1 hypothetical protein [Tenacibaculum finnmarkense]MCM8907046.1 hypothetical protein [Tenacibaculum finnmarkense genomovar finnmarkense]
MKKKIRFITFLFSLFFSVAMIANTITDPIKKDSIATKLITKIIKTNSVKTFRSFSSLNKFDKVTAALTQQRFTEQGYKFNTADSIENKKWLDKATNTFKKVEELGNYIEFLTKDGLGQLPVAIKPVSISNAKYTVGIAKAVFKPAYTELTVFLKVEIPSTNSERGDQILILGASNVKLSHTGGIIGDAKLNLISQFTTNFNQGSILLTLKGSFEKPGTYAIIDCGGFKEMGLDANIKFANGLLYPVDKKGKKKIGYVNADFKTTISDWNDMVVNISLPEFGIKGIKGTTFKLNTAVFDFSDLRNDEATPKAYLNKYYSGTPNLWRGVYVKSLKVILPQEFNKKGNKKNRVSFGASDLIIDGQGVTGKFIGENIIGLKEGDASGWDFSLDYFLIDIETNNLKSGEFKGKLVLPVSRLDSLKYQAIFQSGEGYTLKVGSQKDINFDVFNAAKAHLTKDSSVKMVVKDGKFRPKAVLHGDITISTSISKKGATATTSAAPAAPKKKKAVSFEGIEFQNMVLQTESPMFSVGSFGTKGRLGLAGFPVSINKIGLRTPGGNRAELLFDLEVNLMSSGDGGNGGSTQLVIKGKLDEAGNKWKFDDVTLEKLHIKMEIAGTQLQGAIFIFDEDPTYGTGFAGAVGAKFSKGLNLEVQAKALFGRTEKFRYWFADAQVTIPGGIPVFTGFSLNSFGGGIYSRMKMDGVSKKADAAFEEIGASTSGILYVPYEGSALGMKASVGITTQGSEDLFHATVEFGIAFRKSGGLQEIYFKGYGELLAALPADYYDVLEDNLSAISDENVEISNKQISAAISADVFIGFDFVNDIFQSTSEVYVNFGVIKGVGPSGRAGWLDFYVAADEWHLLIGTPEDRIGIEMDLAILKVKMDSYFMTGDNLPGSPPPPAIVADILGVDVANLDSMRDLNMLESGNGMAYGASYKITTGDLTFLIFYAHFEAGVGFDIMLKNYGDAHCKGSSEPIGMNGWYANGQAYAYLQGELGLNFKLFGSKKKIPIISGGGAVLLQARLPNPAWFRGYLGGKYNLLGGLIKGRFRFKIELGDQCEIVGGSPLEGVVVIGDLKPKEGSAEVDVFAAPKVVFNLQINKVFEIPDETGARKYKILLDEFSVKNSGKSIVGEVKWNDKNDVAVFYSHEILPPNTQLKAFVELHFEEFKNGTWETMKADGKVSTETKEVTFTTGKAPKTIPLNNIAYMYPVLGQKNLFIEQYGTAYINLKKGQNYLFGAVPNSKKIMVMSSESDSKIEKPYTYNSAKKQIVYSLPSNNMAKETAYNVTLKLISEGNSNINDNVSETYNEKKIGSKDANNTAEVKSKTADQAATKDGERELLTYNFRTSQYDTFKDKMDDMKTNNDLYKYVIDPYQLTLIAKIDRQEPFDLLELRGNKYSGNAPLVVVRAVLDDSYYKNQIYPLLYHNYPLMGKIKVSRDTNKIGVPPVEAVEPISWYLDNLEDGYTNDISFYNPYRYNLTYYYYEDYEDLRYQLVSLKPAINWQSNPRFEKMIIKAFPSMRRGKYKTTFKYVLPGKVKQGRNNSVKYINPINE